MTRRIRIWGLALAVAATLAVGCSGDDDGGGTAEDTTTTASEPLVESATVERVDEDTLTIAVEAGDGGPVAVLASEDPDDFSGATEVATIEEGSGEIEVDDPDPVSRVQVGPEGADRQPAGMDVLEALAVGVPDLVEVPPVLAQRRRAGKGRPDQAQKAGWLGADPAPAPPGPERPEGRHPPLGHQPIHHLDLGRIKADQDYRRAVGHVCMVFRFTFSRKGSDAEVHGASDPHPRLQ